MLNNHPSQIERRELRLDSIPREQIDLTLNSLLCERLYQFKRTLDAGGNWQWSAIRTRPDGTEEEVHELLDVMNDNNVCMGLLKRFCEYQSWGFTVSRAPGRPNHPDAPVEVSLFMVTNDSADPPELGLICRVSGSTLGLSVALALCGAAQLDPMAHHRELFPGHYMTLS